MENELDAIKKEQNDRQQQRIKDIKQKIGTTRYNIEVSEEIIAETPSDAQQEKIKDKNANRRHAKIGRAHV